MFDFNFVVHYFCPLWFCNHLDEEGRGGCFAFIVFLMSCECKCYVALPHVALGFSAMWGCDIS